MPRPAVIGALAVCVAAALWGVDGVVLTPRLYNLEVPLVVLLLHAVPFLLMQPLLAGSYRSLARLRAADWLTLLLVSATGGLVGTLAIVHALFLVGFRQLSVVVLLQKLQPLFAFGLAWLLLGERPRRRFLVLAAVAVLGGYWLAFGLRWPDFERDAATAQAALWAVVAAAAFGSATVLGKRLLGSLDFRHATFARYGVTTVLAALVVAGTGRGLGLSEVTAQNWLIVGIIALTTGSGAIFLYYFGLNRLRASVAAICELCLPLAAVLCDYAVNGSRLGPWQWLGGLLLVGAITLVSIHPRRQIGLAARNGSGDRGV